MGRRVRLTRIGPAALALLALGLSACGDIALKLTVRELAAMSQRITFWSDRDEPVWGEIYVMEYDGSGVERITNNAEAEAAPYLSPDGRYLTFASQSGQRVKDLETGIMHTILDTQQYDLDPWSPAGNKLLLWNGGGGYSTCNPDGSGRVPIPIPDYNQPSWSPDSRRLLYWDSSTGNSEIMTCSAYGTNVKNLTQNLANDEHPYFSPDGSRIAFCSIRDGGGLFVMDADGGNPHKVCDSNAPLIRWSPDGRSLLFVQGGGFWVAKQDPADAYFVPFAGIMDVYWAPNAQQVLISTGSDIWSAYVDGTFPKNLTNTGLDSFLGVSDDGSRILLLSERTGNLEVFTMDLDGGDQRNLTNHPATDGNASW
jgi:Tol biopolymer transport system component